MLTKRSFCLLSIVLGIVLIPSAPALLQSVNSSSVIQNNKNSVAQDNPALLPSTIGSKPSDPVSSTITNDSKSPIKLISVPEVKPSETKPSDPVSSTITSDPKSPAKVISVPEVKPSETKPSDPVSSTITNDPKSPAKVISVPEVKPSETKPSDPVSSTITNDPKSPAKVISVPDIKSSIPTPETKASEATVKPSVITRSNNDLVDLEKIAPHIRKDIRYATSNNFMNRKLYPVARCLLRAKVAEQLKQVQIELEKDNLGLKVFDCYRPLSIQKQMWKILPDNNYVANPAQGSRHNRASAVDLTLVNFSTGKDKEMPSKYDEFSKRAHMDYEGTSIEAKKNRNHLRTVMQKHGFKSIPTEWWHYDSSEWKQYPLLDISWN